MRITRTRWRLHQHQWFTMIHSYSEDAPAIGTIRPDPMRWTRWARVAAHWPTDWPSDHSVLLEFVPWWLPRRVWPSSPPRFK